jgi:hypothetical protein
MEREWRSRRTGQWRPGFTAFGDVPGRAVQAKQGKTGAARAPPRPTATAERHDGGEPEQRRPTPEFDVGSTDVETPSPPYGNQLFTVQVGGAVKTAVLLGSR